YFPAGPGRPVRPRGSASETYYSSSSDSSSHTFLGAVGRSGHHDRAGRGCLTRNFPLISKTGTIVCPFRLLAWCVKRFGCDYFSTTPKWLGISGIAGSVGSVGPSKCRAIKIAPGFRSIGACQLLLGQVRKRRSRQSFHPPEKQPQLTILADGVSIERRHFRVEF